MNAIRRGVTTIHAFCCGGRVARIGGKSWIRASLSSTGTGSSPDLTHVDERGVPTMVDVGDKKISTRTATAQSHLRVPDAVMSLMSSDGEMRSKKGPVFATAIIAGTMAAKRTHELIPFCHPLGIESCKIHIQAEGSNMIAIECKVKVTGKTGVEMEALTGASVAALTIYDMCKAVSHDMTITTSLVGKTGGKSDINKINEDNKAR